MNHLGDYRVEAEESRTMMQEAIARKDAAFNVCIEKTPEDGGRTYLHLRRSLVTDESMMPKFRRVVISEPLRIGNGPICKKLNNLPKIGINKLQNWNKINHKVSSKWLELFWCQSLEKNTIFYS